MTTTPEAFESSPAISEQSRQRLVGIRRRNEERKAAEASGVIGGARAEFDIDFLLRYIDSQKPLTIDAFDELEDYLQDLNYEHGQDTTAILARGVLFFVYCTDPDGEWFIEASDPRERMEEDDDGPFYARQNLDHLRDLRGPYTILREPKTAK